MAILFRLAIFLLVCLVGVCRAIPAFEAIQGNKRFQSMSKMANDQIVAANEAAGQEIITPPEKQKGLMRLGVSTSPTPTPSTSPTPSSTPSPSASPTPSASPSVSASVSPSSAPSSSPAASPSVSSSSVPSHTPSSSPEPAKVECPQISFKDYPVPNSQLQKAKLIANSPSALYHGKERGVCAFYLNVPENVNAYTVSVKAEGDVDLYVGLRSYPLSSYSKGSEPACVSATSSSHEFCDGGLEGSDKLFLKMEGWEKFSNGIIEVSFANTVNCPQFTIDGGRAPNSELIPAELSAGTPSNPHYGDYFAVCSFYVDVPVNVNTYTATLSALGDVDLYVAFNDYPWSYTTHGLVPECSSNSGSEEERCQGHLKGNDKLYLKLEGWDSFRNGILDVRFNTIRASPSPAPGAVICPQTEVYSDGPSRPLLDDYKVIDVNTPVGKHYGEERSVCMYAFLVPKDASTYEAKLDGYGDVDLYVALEGPPWSGNSDGLDPLCSSTSYTGHEYCAGEVDGSKEEYVFLWMKLDGFSEFSHATLQVNFNVPLRSSSRRIGAQIIDKRESGTQVVPKPHKSRDGEDLRSRRERNVDR